MTSLIFLATLFRNRILNKFDDRYLGGNIYANLIPKDLRPKNVERFRPIKTLPFFAKGLILVLLELMNADHQLTVLLQAETSNARNRF